MAQADTSTARGRAVRGIEAAAFVLGHAVDAYAVAGGEGAARLRVALEALPAPRPADLGGEGLEAARAAVGAAAAGKRVALVASGDALVATLPALREMARLGLPVLVVVPSHGPDGGGSLPERGFDDVAHLLSLPIGLFVAGDPAQVADFALAGLRAAHDRGAPWVLAFELATVGLALGNALLPDAGRIQQLVSSLGDERRERASITGPFGALTPPGEDLDRHAREVERFAFAANASMREIERANGRKCASVIAEGVNDADVVIVATGAPAMSARRAVAALHANGPRHVGVVQVASLRPFPAAEIVRLAWRARAVLVHEPMPDPLGAGGQLSAWVRAAFADALTWHPAFAGIGRIPPVVTVLGDDVSSDRWTALARTVTEAGDPARLVYAAPTSGGTIDARVDIVMHEGEREEALRLVGDALARTGRHGWSHYTPNRAVLTVARSAEARGVASVLLVCQGGVWDAAKLFEGLAQGTLLVLAGEWPDKVLAEAIRVGAPRGVRVATLGGHGEAVQGREAIAAVVRTLLAGEGAELDRALGDALRDAGVKDDDAVVARVRTLADLLGAHIGWSSDAKAG